MEIGKIMERLMATFREELEEHVRHFNEDLMALEKNPPAAEQAERFKTLFRTAHSLKGAARSVNVGPIEAACHHLEGILSGVRDGARVLDAKLFSLLFAAVDAFEEAGMRLREQQELADAPLAALLPYLAAAAEMTADGAGAPEPRPNLSEHRQRVTEEQPAPPAPREAQPAALEQFQFPCGGGAGVPPVGGTKVTGGTPVPPHAGRQMEIENALIAANAAPAPAPAARDPGEASGVVRVAAEKLDTLLARVGELQVAQRRVEARVGDLVALRETVAQWKAEWKRVDHFFAKEALAAGAGGAADRGAAALPKRVAGTLRQAGEKLRALDIALDRLTVTMTGDSRLLDQVTRPLDDEVRRVRMLPFADACAGLDRMTRDLAHALSKDIDLRIDGGAVELDRSILEGLKDPLRHLVRNAIDHGVEPPADRVRAGKPRRATVRITAALRGSLVEITVEDDGRGIDLEGVRAQAGRRKIDAPADAAELARLIFHPGFSTAAIVTDVSGRGVGLDVVKDRVEALHGTVDLSFTAGRGTRFTLTAPLTLTTLRAVLVRAGGRTFAVAGTNVQKMAHAHAADIRTVAGRDTLSCDGVPLALASLGSVLDPQFTPEDTRDKIPVLIVAAGPARMAFAVDELLTEQEILIKNLGPRIRRVPFVAGATLLPSGRIALVLNAANLVRGALQAGSGAGRRPAVAAPSAARRRLLVVEDSMTTRALMKSILEAAGYDIVTASDGQAGWQYLQGADVDLVVSDVDMPAMNGFELTAAIRASKRHGELPVILVTARGTDADKTRGVEAGANAYLVKGAFDQRNLLETISQMV